MGKLIDLTGQKFGLLEVVGKAQSEYDECGTIRVNWMYRCECGDMDVTRARYLQRGSKTNCGSTKCRIKDGKLKLKAQ